MEDWDLHNEDPRSNSRTSGPNEEHDSHYHEFQEREVAHHPDDRCNEGGYERGQCEYDNDGDLEGCRGGDMFYERTNRI